MSRIGLHESAGRLGEVMRGAARGIGEEGLDVWLSGEVFEDSGGDSEVFLAATPRQRLLGLSGTGGEVSGGERVGEREGGDGPEEVLLGSVMI